MACGCWREVLWMAEQQQRGVTEPPALVLAQELLVKKGNAPKAYLSVSASTAYLTNPL